MRPLEDVSHTSISLDEAANQNIVDKHYRVATAFRQSLIPGALASACQYASYRIQRLALLSKANHK